MKPFIEEWMLSRMKRAGGAIFLTKSKSTVTDELDTVVNKLHEAHEMAKFAGISKEHYEVIFHDTLECGEYGLATVPSMEPSGKVPLEHMGMTKTESMNENNTEGSPDDICDESIPGERDDLASQVVSEFADNIGDGKNINKVGLKETEVTDVVGLKNNEDGKVGGLKSLMKQKFGNASDCEVSIACFFVFISDETFYANQNLKY